MTRLGRPSFTVVSLAGSSMFPPHAASDTPPHRVFLDFVVVFSNQWKWGPLDESVEPDRSGSSLTILIIETFLHCSLSSL
jgi:hypothetical protein